MGHVARMKSMSGGRAPYRLTDAHVASNILNIPDSHNSFSLLFSSTATITKINAAGRILDGRTLFFRGEENTAAVTFTNTNLGMGSQGTMDLGGSNIVLDDTDTIELNGLADGTWVRKAEEATN